MADETTTTSDCADIGRIVSDEESNAELLQSIRDLRAFRVRAAHLVTEIREQFRDAAHADAADTDEVNAARPPEHQDRSSSWNARSTIALAASGFASPRAAPAIASRRGASLARAMISLRQRLSGHLRLRQHLGGAPASDNLRVLPLMIVGGRRERDKHRGLPSRGQLGQRRRAGATDHQVGGLHLPIHGEEERLDPGREPGGAVAGADGVRDRALLSDA